jgi:amidase
MTICHWSAVDLARAIRDKQLSAREVVAAHLSQIERLNPSVNAIVTFDPDRAMQLALQADEAIARGEAVGPLHGLPIAHKDLLLTKGTRTTFGSPIYRDFVPTENSLIVERVQRAGAIPVGKTNTPEFGAGSQTFNPVFGPTRNPFELTKTCGGSTGGGAVALACGMLPIADGTDMGGSLRNPASFCGVVGLRPTPGLVPVWPAANAWSTLSVDGPMARSAADVALLLSAMAGADARSPLSLEVDPLRFAAPLDRDFRGVRIAWWTGLGGLPFERPIVDVVNAQRKVFESLGCDVGDAEPDFSNADEVFKVLRAFAFVTNLSEVVRDHRDLVKATILWEIDRGLRLTATDLARAERGRAEIHHRMRQIMERFDFFVLPVTQVEPFDVSNEWVASINGVAMTTYIDWMKSCYYISVTGAPAISVPCGFTPRGMPVGIQIVGRPRDDWGLLQIAHAFEQASGVERRWPLSDA